MRLKIWGKGLLKIIMGDFCHFVSRIFVSPDIWHEMLQRNVWKHELICQLEVPYM